MAIILRENSDGTATYRVQIWNKRQVIASASFDDEYAAKIWESKMKQALAQGKLGGIQKARNTSLSQALDYYLSRVTIRKKGAYQERNRILTLKQYDMCRKSLANIDSSDMAQFRDLRLETVSGTTVRKELSIFSSLFNRAAKEWKMKGLENPVVEIKLPDINGFRERRLEGNEFELLIENAQAHNEMSEIITLAVETAIVPIP